MDTLHSGLMPGGARLENLLNMFKAGDLGDPNGDVKTMRVLPLACKAVLELQKRNERLEEQVRRRSWKTFHTVPEVGAEILIWCRDSPVPRVSVVEIEEDAIMLFSQAPNDEILWMPIE